MTFARRNQTPTRDGRTSERGPSGDLPAWPAAAVSGSGTRCASCGTVMPAGALLAAVDCRTGDSYVLCRPSVRLGCLTFAGAAHVSAIELYDETAARAFDIERGGDSLRQREAAALASHQAASAAAPNWRPR